jgi:hypothetical protein
MVNLCQSLVMPMELNRRSLQDALIKLREDSLLLVAMDLARCGTSVMENALLSLDQL